MSYDGQEKSTYGGAPVELYRFVCGSLQLCYTSGDVPVDLSSNVYACEVISRGEIDASDEDQQGALSVTLPRDNAVAELFIAGLPPQPVHLTLYRFHRGDSEVVQFWNGQVAAVQFSGSEAKLSCLPELQSLHRMIPRLTYCGQCNWALYSTGCGVSAAAYMESGTVTAVSGSTVTVLIVHDRASGYFNNGFVQIGSGERQWVVTHTRISASVAQLKLLAPLTSVAVGAAMALYPGCDRTLTDCKNRYNNLAHFLGFPWLPTRNPFVQGI